MKRGNSWAAAITHNKKYIHIGCYKNIKDAAKAYNEKAKEFVGEFAVLNYISDDEEEEEEESVPNNELSN